LITQCLFTCCLTDPSTTDVSSLSLHDALPISWKLDGTSLAKLDTYRDDSRVYSEVSMAGPSATDVFNGHRAVTPRSRPASWCTTDRKSTRLNSSHEWISYAVFCLKKKRKSNKT